MNCCCTFSDTGIYFLGVDVCLNGCFLYFTVTGRRSVLGSCSCWRNQLNFISISLGVYSIDDNLALRELLKNHNILISFYQRHSVTIYTEHCKTSTYSYCLVWIMLAKIAFNFNIVCTTNQFRTIVVNT